VRGGFLACCKKTPSVENFRDFWGKVGGGVVVFGQHGKMGNKPFWAGLEMFHVEHFPFWDAYQRMFHVEHLKHCK
jgi:hypothetical protein